MKQDIWSWKIFPYEIFIRCISWRAKICRKDFNIVESLEFKKCVAINQFSINCNSNKSLKIISCLMMMILIFTILTFPLNVFNSLDPGLFW